MRNDLPRILVCGSRDLGFQDTEPTKEQTDEYYFISKIIDEVVLEKDWISKKDSLGNWLPRFHMIHGDARGVDTCADDYATVAWIPCTPMPANWAKYGKRAGYLRNVQMLEEGKPDLVIAIYRSKSNPSKGTLMMANIARKAGVEVKEYYYNE